MPKIMLASHMDEIGFMVKHITKEGFLKFTCLGGWWEQVMLSQRVTVHGSKGDLVGVIGTSTYTDTGRTNKSGCQARYVY